MYLKGEKDIQGISLSTCKSIGGHRNGHKTKLTELHVSNITYLIDVNYFSKEDSSRVKCPQVYLCSEKVPQNGLRLA